MLDVSGPAPLAPIFTENPNSRRNLRFLGQNALFGLKRRVSVNGRRLGVNGRQAGVN
jgi:hypothetical protein